MFQSKTNFVVKYKIDAAEWWVTKNSAVGLLVAPVHIEYS